MYRYRLVEGEGEGAQKRWYIQQGPSSSEQPADYTGDLVEYAICYDKLTAITIIDALIQQAVTEYRYLTDKPECSHNWYKLPTYFGLVEVCEGECGGFRYLRPRL